MNVTFLVGNGFDISAGLKTSYRDFYTWYLSQSTDDPAVTKVKAHIEEDRK